VDVVKGTVVGGDPTGQMVVYSATVSVVTWPTLAGQLVTVGAQELHTSQHYTG
jgi:hypothetical protein